MISRLWRAILAWDGWYMFPFTVPVMDPLPVLAGPMPAVAAPVRAPYTPITECTACVRDGSDLWPPLR